MKSKLDFLEGYDHDELDLPRVVYGSPLPHLVQGLDSCLGVPRHHNIGFDFVSRALINNGKRHDRVLEFVLVHVSRDNCIATL